MFLRCDENLTNRKRRDYLLVILSHIYEYRGTHSKEGSSSLISIACPTPVLAPVKRALPRYLLAPASITRISV